MAFNKKSEVMNKGRKQLKFSLTIYTKKIDTKVFNKRKEKEFINIKLSGFGLFLILNQSFFWSLSKPSPKKP